MKTSLRLISALLAVLMLSGAFAGCAGKTEKTDGKVTVTDHAATSSRCPQRSTASSSVTSTPS